MSVTRSLIVVVLTATVLPLLVSVPALASPRSVGFSNGLASIVKAHDSYCASIKGDMMINEDLANAAVDAHQDPTPYSDAADAAQAKGESAGCGWAL